MFTADFVCVVDSSSDDDSSVMDDDLSRSSSVAQQPPMSRADPRGPSPAPRSQPGGGGVRTPQSSASGRGATPPSAATRDVDVTSRASGLSSRPTHEINDCSCDVGKSRASNEQLYVVFLCRVLFYESDKNITECLW